MRGLTSKRELAGPSRSTRARTVRAEPAPARRGRRAQGSGGESSIQRSDREAPTGGSESMPSWLATRVEVWSPVSFDGLCCREQRFRRTEMTCDVSLGLASGDAAPFGRSARGAGGGREPTNAEPQLPLDRLTSILSQSNVALHGTPIPSILTSRSKHVCSGFVLGRAPVTLLRSAQTARQSEGRKQRHREHPGLRR